MVRSLDIRLRRSLRATSVSGGQDWRLKETGFPIRSGMTN